MDNELADILWSTCRLAMPSTFNSEDVAEAQTCYQEIHHLTRLRRFLSAALRKKVSDALTKLVHSSLRASVGPPIKPDWSTKKQRSNLYFTVAAPWDSSMYHNNGWPLSLKFPGGRWWFFFQINELRPFSTTWTGNKSVSTVTSVESAISTELG